jgi:hypothetical protein
LLTGFIPKCAVDLPVLLPLDVLLVRLFQKKLSDSVSKYLVI